MKYLKQLKIKKIVVISITLLTLLALLTTTGYSSAIAFSNSNTLINNNTTSANGVLTVHFLDVGQADATLIQLPNGQVMLIDGGESKNDNSILRYIRNLNITKIDYLIATHPHADHIGGLPAIIEALNIGSIYAPKVSHTTDTYVKFLTAIDKKGIQIDSATAGVSILSSQGLQIDIVAPTRNYSDLNDNSAVIKITYDTTSFLFMGDAGTRSENNITANISADVLKIGHHGQTSISTIPGLEKQFQ